MNNRRSYLESLNTGRRRRPSSAIEHLAQTLEELESRIARPQAGGTPQADPRASAARSASEVSALRDELRQQMSTGLRREFAALKADIERAFATPRAEPQAAELSAEFERLSGMIRQLAERTDDRQINLLRLEMEQVKNALGKLAREETLQSVDRRWDEFDQRWSAFEDRLSSKPDADPAIQALTSRLEEIGGAVNSLPSSVTLRSLEEKMKLLATAVDRFAHQQQDRGGPAAMEAIEERLDEISRAIAASSAIAHTANFDPEPFQRIEARISSLAHQIQELMEDDTTGVLAGQLATLSERVDDIAKRVDLPDQAIERFADQITAIAAKLDNAAPAMPDMDRVFRSLEDRFVMLSDMLDQRQGDAIEQSQALFQELERRLEEVASRIDAAPDMQDRGGLIEAMDEHFAELAARLERNGAAAGDAAIRSIETRLEDISLRLERTAHAELGLDKDLILSLEAQVAALSSHLATPAGDLAPRLDEIERSIVEGRQDVIVAARQAAEDAVRSFAGSAAETTLVKGLAEDLRALETLTRKSDDRNAKTFEAIHDTLLKIVERLATIESGAARTPDDRAAPSGRQLGVAAPSIQSDLDQMELVGLEADEAEARTPATAAALAAEAALAEQEGASETERKRSVLGGLTRALSGRKASGRVKRDAFEPAPTVAKSAAPSVELDEPLAPEIANQPLEPGSGAPDLNAIMRRVRDERGPALRGSEPDAAKSDFIAAARRAAQAAAAEAEMLKRPASKSSTTGFSIGGLLKRNRKPVMMGIAAILMALTAMQLGKSLLAENAELAATDTPTPVAVEEVADEKTAAVAPAETEVSRDSGAATAANPEAPSAKAAMMTAASTADVTTEWLDSVSAATAAPAMEEEAAVAPTPVTPAEAAQEIGAAAAGEAVAAIPLEAGPVALREAAAAGDAKALYEIGNRYAEGQGVETDLAKAASWYERAAELGLAPAQYRIGNLYEKGIGVARDVAKAKTWYQMAAAQGNASAMHNLAVLFAMGADSVADNESAARWFLEAAELGVKDSQFNLGILSAKGVGMQQDLEEAYKWFDLVARTGDKDAAEKRDEIARTLNPDQLEKSKAAAELWQPKEIDAQANTVEVPDGWREDGTTTSSIDMKQAVKNIQTILNKNGYDAGATDGVMGQKTKNAISAFQKDSGMAATGEVDEPLVRALLARR
ncbi:peptidoglycan-binding protein [Aquamicrobium sp. LC103]|uniref:peptidoglycan-binding protein n=1 Tax=Aquamicrobium sp. LC103 TaxID=1120658 RepID=UPI00063EBF27|nr:peptidoglycan-binding protein [Aquamicrobium sp. LC103]TKT74235.1 peptidoglycan-binding protein [Aquamicrobium sp. LC103]